MSAGRRRWAARSAAVCPGVSKGEKTANRRQMRRGPRGRSSLMVATVGEVGRAVRSAATTAVVLRGLLEFSSTPCGSSRTISASCDRAPSLYIPLIGWTNRFPRIAMLILLNDDLEHAWKQYILVRRARNILRSSLPRLYYAFLALPNPLGDEYTYRRPPSEGPSPSPPPSALDCATLLILTFAPLFELPAPPTRHPLHSRLQQLQHATSARSRRSRFCQLDRGSCFGELKGLAALKHTLASRFASAPKGSYTKRLFNEASLLQSKITEEADELCRSKTPDDVAFEAADLLYFALTKCIASGVGIADIERSLAITRRPGNAKPQFVKPAQAAEPSKPTSAPVDPDAPIRMRTSNLAAASKRKRAAFLCRPVLRSDEMIAKVKPIVDDVRTRADAALIELTAKFDRVQLHSPALRSGGDRWTWPCSSAAWSLTLFLLRAPSHLAPRFSPSPLLLTHALTRHHPTDANVRATNVAAARTIGHVAPSTRQHSATWPAHAAPAAPTPHPPRHSPSLRNTTPRHLGDVAMHARASSRDASTSSA
ncbi:hypothetical protein EV121DRAFT_297435 [Schizophyllum commune]